jgi:hypothetical protein
VNIKKALSNMQLSFLAQSHTRSSKQTDENGCQARKNGLHRSNLQAERRFL